MYEETGSELVALLKENEEIKKHKPKFNRALKQTQFSYGLYLSNDLNNYKNLSISKIKDASPITAFKSFKSGKHYLNNVANKYNLCLKLCHLDQSPTHCFNFQIDECFGACTQVEPNEYTMKELIALSKNFHSKIKLLHLLMVEELMTSAV